MDPQPQSSIPSGVPPKPRSQNIGGWLLVLLIGLCCTPISAFNETDRVFSVFDKLAPLTRWGLCLCLSLHWAIALVAIYCACVLYDKRPHAVKVTKRAMILIVILSWVGVVIFMFMVALPLNITGPNLGGSVLGLGFLPTVWVIIWHAYFRHSKRVRSTFPKEFEGNGSTML